MNETEEIRNELVELLRNFESGASADLRQQVLSLIPVWRRMNALGSSLLPLELRKAARDRILFYFKSYPGVVISQEELTIVAGISQWARRVRELRVEYGWPILSGTTVREMITAHELEPPTGSKWTDMKPSDYVMSSVEQDREAAYRWKVAKEIRNKKTGVKAKILEFLRHNVGKTVSGEELRYVAKDRTEWARRVRELRTEEGWPISTHWNGRPELQSGMYLLEEDRQLPAHDRVIPDKVRCEVLVRDNYACQDCRWSREQWNQDDPRHLELHHIEQHSRGGANKPENLVTLCNICHDSRHAKR